jgi:hypothetical protein
LRWPIFFTQKRLSSESEGDVHSRNTDLAYAMGLRRSMANPLLKR